MEYFLFHLCAPFKIFVLSFAFYFFVSSNLKKNLNCLSFISLFALSRPSQFFALKLIRLCFFFDLRILRRIEIIPSSIPRRVQLDCTSFPIPRLSRRSSYESGRRFEKTKMILDLNDWTELLLKGVSRWQHVRSSRPGYKVARGET